MCRATGPLMVIGPKSTFANWFKTIVGIVLNEECVFAPQSRRVMLQCLFGVREHIRSGSVVPHLDKGSRFSH